MTGLRLGGTKGITTATAMGTEMPRTDEPDFRNYQNISGYETALKRWRKKRIVELEALIEKYTTLYGEIEDEEEYSER